MVVAFDGYDIPPLNGDVKGYLETHLAKEARYRRALLYCYYPKGKLVSSKTFDDRSNAFGVVQLTLSHGVSDTAKLWFYIWRDMGGDTSATPYYHPGKQSESVNRSLGRRTKIGEQSHGANPGS